MSNPIPYVSPTDSSATMMRAVAAALAGEWMIPQQWPAHLVALTGPANRLPVNMRTWLVAREVRNVGVSPQLANEVSSAGLAEWAVGLYEGPGASTTDTQYDTIVIGAASGGVAHLAALLGAPFLSQSFVTHYRYRGAPDDVAAYQAFGSRLSETIATRNGDLAVINHYDPIHDRALVPFVNYLRMKLLDLPRPYAEFIRRRLRPGGTVLFCDCQFNWGQYRIGKRRYFQVGGLGGITDTDWVRDAPQARAFLAAHGQARRTNWALPYPWLPEPESEWGSLPPFRQAVEDFAAENGYRFRVLRGAHPEDFARLAFYAAYQAALNAGREPAGVLIDCFTQTSPTAALRAGLLPLWLPFNCTDSLEFLRRMAPNFPHGKPVLLTLAPTFTPAWDTVALADWQAACGAEAQITWIGVDRAAYPVDLAALFRFVPQLQAWCASHPTAPRTRFTVDDLSALVGSMAAAASAESG